MDSESAKALFRKCFKGKKNFMTPTVLQYGWAPSGRYAYEVSAGKGIDGKTPIYGVTVVNKDGTHNTDLSESVDSLQDVERLLLKIRILHYSETSE